ncbi:MAG: BtpA/SgcQ family protein [Spirochaetia bacterium]|nr:BtpA/SgcQ family protein [Spirochaetia bacterium]
MKNNEVFTDIFGISKPMIGMVHVKALPGTPGYDAQAGVQGIIEHAVLEAQRLQEGGIDAIQIENQFDKPFLKPEHINYEIVAVITAIGSAIKAAVDIPFGINVHLNGVIQSIAIAQATGAKWIRAFELANAYISNSGYVEASAPEAMRYRRMIQAEQVRIFGDFHVKHGSHFIINDRTLAEQAEDIESCGGDAIILTSTTTGKAPDVDDAKMLRDAVRLPILVGSGFSAANAAELMPYVDGAIVGSSLKIDGKIANDIDVNRVRELMETVNRLR